jgi:Transglycosylase
VAPGAYFDQVRNFRIYLNSIFLGRGAWGIELAAGNYFDKSSCCLDAAGRRHAGGHGQGAHILQPRSASRSCSTAPCLRGERVWVGYDNADGKRRTLGDGQAGPRVAVPIFEPIIEATWVNYARETPLNPPSREAEKDLVALPIDLGSGKRISERGAQAFFEYFRIRGGKLNDTQYHLVSATRGSRVALAPSGGVGDYRRDPGWYYQRSSNAGGFCGNEVRNQLNRLYSPNPSARSIR